MLISCRNFTNLQSSICRAPLSQPCTTMLYRAPARVVKELSEKCPVFIYINRPKYWLDLLKVAVSEFGLSMLILNHYGPYAKTEFIP